MDEPVLTLGATRLQAEPGGQVQLSVTVRNPGRLVESFRLDVVGLDPSWWQVHPPELPVYPGKEESAVVVLSPPARAEAPEHALPFAVRAVSSLDADRSVVEEGDLEVGRILDLQAVIEPVTSRGRWRGRHRITYTNWGNSTVHLRLSVTDKDQQLGFRLEPEQVSVPVGGTAGARLQVRPQKPFLRGAAVHRPFQVIGESGASGPVGVPRSPAARAGVAEPGRPVLDGALQQVPILSRAVVVLAGLLLLATVGLVGAAFRTGQVKGAPTPDAAPEAPAEVTATAADTLIQVRWDPTDRALGYQVQQVDEATGAKLAAQNVAAGLTAFDDKVGEPLTRRCYVVVAVRGNSQSPASEQVCATTGDGRLDPPTRVRAAPVAAGYAVSWTGDRRDDHVVLLDGAPVGAPIPAGQSNVTVPAPGGPHCLSVVARRGEDRSSLPSAQVCADSGAPVTGGPGAPGTGTPGGTGGTDGSGGVAGPDGAGGGGQPSPGTPGATPSGPGASAPGTAPAGGTGVSGWVALFGPYQEQTQAQLALDRAVAAGFGARLLRLPVAQLPPELRLGIVVVVDQLPDRQAATAVCDTVRASVGTTCRPVLASG